MSNKPFTNPWPLLVDPSTGLDNSSTLSRLQSYIHKDTHQFFWSIRGTKGTFVTIVNIMVQKLEEELKRRGITEITQREEFEHFVSNSTLCLADELNKTYVERAIKSTDSTGTATRLHGSSTGGIDRPTSASNVNRRGKGKGGKIKSVKGE